MKMFALVLPALMVGSMAFAQAGGAAAAPAGGDTMAAAPKNAKEAKKHCKEESAGDKKAFKKCMKDWKTSQGK